MLSVVMPAHNEAGYLETAVRDVDEGLRDRGHELEILVVENGSTDETLAIGRHLADEIPSLRISTRAVADYGGVQPAPPRRVLVVVLGYARDESDAAGRCGADPRALPLPDRLVRHRAGDPDPARRLPIAELPVTAQERPPSRTPIWQRVPRTPVGMIELRLTLWRERRCSA